MNETRQCPECGATLPPDAPAGACPRCLLAVGLEEAPPAEEREADEAPPQKPARSAPPIEDVAPHFPTLEILELIGFGGMGIVYKARQRSLDRMVALKVLWPELGADKSFADRFSREARALARLDHRHIVRVHEFGERDGFYYLIMEYVDGASLRTLLDAGEVHPREALAIVPQICDALQYAHDQGIVHRDIKPANVLVDSTGLVKIADFGLAKLIEQKEDEHTLTRAGQVMGTLHYMAPEQYRTPGDVDHRADIYSLGVVFYEMLTGEVPMGRFEPPSRKVEVDVRLDEVVLRALERERDRRYQRAAEIGTQVTRISSTEEASPPPPPEPAAAAGAATAAADGAAEPQGIHKTFGWSSGERRPGAKLDKIGVVGCVLLLLATVGMVAGLFGGFPWAFLPIVVICGGTGFLLGIVSWVRIASSKGRVYGYAYAVGATLAAPALSCGGLALGPLLLTHVAEIGPIKVDEQGIVETRDPAAREKPELSGGPEWMEASDREKQYPYILAMWRNVQSESKSGGPRLPLTSGHFIYGPIHWDRLVETDKLIDDDEEQVAMRAGTLGLPLLTIPKTEAPLWKYRIVSVHFGEDDPDVARVVAETKGWRLEFGMHRRDGSWYHDFKPVKRERAAAAETPVAEPKKETGARDVGLSGGPAWMSDIDRQEHLQHMQSQFRILRERTVFQTPREIVEEAGEYLYGPDELAGIPALTDTDFDHVQGYFGLPTLRFPDELPPLGKYRIGSVTFSETGEEASVHATYSPRGMLFSMVRRNANWYFAAAPVKFHGFAAEELKDPRLDSVLVKLRQLPESMGLREQRARRMAAVALWDRVRRLDPADLDHETCIKLYAPQDRATAGAWTDDEWAFILGTYPLGLPILGDDVTAEGVDLTALTVQRVRFDSADGSAVRFTVQHEGVRVFFSVQWIDDAFFFRAPDLRQMGYAPPPSEDR